MRHSVTSVEDLAIDTPDGEQVALSDIADVRLVPAPAVDPARRHIALHRYRRGRRGPGRRRRHGRGRQRPRRVDVPAGVPRPSCERMRADRLTALTGRRAARDREHVLLVLQAAFGSWRLAAASMSPCPGRRRRLLAGFLTGRGCSHWRRPWVFRGPRHRRAQPACPPGHASGAGRRGARRGRASFCAVGERLAPILMTALATGWHSSRSCCSATGRPRDLRPMAVVVVGGLITSALMSLFVVPAMYLRS